VGHNLIIRGFDDKVHAELGQMADQRGLSINSIVKDAVDKWLKHEQSQAPRKHHLVIYSDDGSMMGLLKSMDRLAKEGDLFRCFCSPPGSPSSELLPKLKWYDATIQPTPTNTIAAGSVNYQDNEHPPLQEQQQQTTQMHQSQKKIIKYFSRVIKNIAENANNKQVFCVDFLINDVAQASLKQALAIEKAYNNNIIAGLTFCPYKTANLLHSDLLDMLELFELHDQIFLLSGDEVYKLHVTKENVHKLFLN
jgi:hypothetical protein